MIMEKENQTEVEETLDLPEVVDGQEDTTDWKAEAKKLQEKAIKQRENTKTLKAKIKELTPAEKKAEATQAKSGDLDNGQKALLVAYGIKGADEMTLAKSWMARTGDDIDVMVGDDIFTAKLASLREAKATQAAIPSGTKRSTTNTKDSVDYHLEQYETGKTQLSDMPFELRSKVLTAKLAKEKAANEFNFTSSS